MSLRTAVSDKALRLMSASAIQPATLVNTAVEALFIYHTQQQPAQQEVPQQPILAQSIAFPEQELLGADASLAGEARVS